MAEEDDHKNFTPPATGKIFVVGWMGAVVLVVGLTAGLVLARDLWIGRQSSELEQQYEQGPRVLVTKVSHSPKSRPLKIPASIHGFVETPIYAKVAGYLKAIKVDKGDRVKAGQVLAMSTRRNSIIKWRTRARPTNSTRSPTIAIRCWCAGGGRAADRRRIPRRMLAAQEALNQLIATQAYEIIKAPFDGIVTARNADPGAMVAQATVSTTASGSPSC